jgi:hypothetical protein
MSIQYQTENGLVVNETNTIQYQAEDGEVINEISSLVAQAATTSFIDPLVFGGAM